MNQSVLAAGLFEFGIEDLVSIEVYAQSGRSGNLVGACGSGSPERVSSLYCVGRTSGGYSICSADWEFWIVWHYRHVSLAVSYLSDVTQDSFAALAHHCELVSFVSAFLAVSCLSDVTKDSFTALAHRYELVCFVSTAGVS